MINYNPKNWFNLIFQFHKSDTFRILFPNMILLGLFTGGLVFAENHYNFSFKSSTIFHQILGFVLSMLLVFRINSAYDRWWEGRKLWGSLVNNTRNLVIKLKAFLPEEIGDEKKELRNMVINFVLVLREHLKNSDDNNNELIPVKNFDLEGLKKADHKPNFIVSAFFVRLAELNKKGIISDTKLLFLNEELRSLLDITGACERIKNTPIPYSYSIFLKKIIFIYVITMPFAFSFDFGYWAIPIVMFIFYAFASLEIVSEEIEDPFGDDANDLPTDEISQKIKANLEELV